jgi:hypothetical protein
MLFMVAHTTGKLKCGKACSMHGNMKKTPKVMRSEVPLAVNMKMVVFCTVTSYTLVINLPDCIAWPHISEDKTRNNSAFI